MFGMGFTEIILIAVVAIIALGPDKLPTAMVDIAKFIKKLKSGIDDAKSTLDNELNIAEMKEEAAKYKAQIENAKNTLKVKENIDLGLNNLINDDMKPKEKKASNEEQVSLKEPKKVDEEIIVEEKDLVAKNEVDKKVEKKDAANKFKVELEDYDISEELK